MARHNSTEDDESTLGGRILQARRRAGLNGAGFARVMGVSAVSAHNWEKNKTAPDAAHLRQIAILLNVSFEWLATGRGGMHCPVQAQCAPPLRDSPPLREAERELLQRFAVASPRQQQALLELLRSWQEG